MKNKGVLYAIGAHMVWGVIPVYFKALHAVPSLQILFHRVAWSFVTLAVVLWLRREWAPFKAATGSWKVVGIYGLAAVLLAINWLVYVWSVNAGHVVDASLGYFINPLVSVALGVLLLREKLRPMQWLPVGLAAAGVLYLTVQFGALPWIALVLAFSFGFYGLLKKVAPLGALHGLSLETALLFLPAVGYLAVLEVQGRGAFGHVDWFTSLLLVLVGIVTVLPLLLFAGAVRSIPLSLAGLVQFVAPTGQFLLGVLLYGEPFDHTRLIGFGIIWIALLIFTLEGFAERRRATLAIEAL
jgi:chloramphenicol-sensitive protein RarD